MGESFSGRYPPDTQRLGRARAAVGDDPVRGLRGLRRGLRSRAFRLVVILSICGALIFAASSALPKRYSSVAWVRVATVIRATTGAKVDLTKDQRAAVQAFAAPQLTAELQRRFGGKLADDSSLIATGILASPLIRIDVEASTASLAAQVADHAAGFVVSDSQHRARAKAVAKSRIETADLAALTVKLNDLASQLANVPVSDPAYPTLKTRIDAAITEYRAAAAAAATDALQARVADGGLEVFASATRPTIPTFPSPMSWTIIGDVVILLVAIGVLYGREELGGRFVNGSASESRRSGTTVLGVLPTPAGTFPPGTVLGAGTTPDVIGLQLVNLVGRTAPAIVLIADVVGDAPDTIGRRVAQAIAESGVRVVFAVCRSVSTRDDRHDVDAAKVSKPLLVVGDQDSTHRMMELDDGIPVNELTAEHARSVLHDLFEFGDVLVLAAPSPTVEPGTLTMTQFADVSVLVAQRGVTRLRDAERAATRLRRVGGNLLGVLVDPGLPTPSAARANAI